jgi:hypothetical protein
MKKKINLLTQFLNQGEFKMKNTNTKVKLSINNEDLRSVSVALVTAVIGRNSTQIRDLVAELDIGLKVGSAKDAVEALEKCVENYEKMSKELANCVDIISLIGDAKVLENLPDLEEDSLGVDGGGE